MLFVALLVPTRRLQAVGWSPRALGGYLLGMLLIGLSFAVLPISARVLVPILVVGYLAPFVTARNGLDRLRRRGPGVGVERRPVKAVSGPARDVPAPAPSSERGPTTGADRDVPPADATARPAEAAPPPATGGRDASDAPDPRDRD